MILSGRARLAGVMGWPVGHSLSPRLHNYWLERYAIDGAYVPLPVVPAHFAASLTSLARLGFAGVNVTVPHKEAALAAVDEADDAARRIGAVNTVVFAPDGRARGSNTDGFGFVENLRAARPGWTCRGGRVTVLGAGGAARAVVAALADDGAADIRLVNRTEPRARALAAAVGGPVTVLGWDKRDKALEGIDLLVNTTVLGMAGNPPLALDLAALPAGAVVCDIVYAPLETPLLAAARRRGNACVDGLGMLLHQARPGFAAWFGRDPEVTEEARAFVLEGLTARTG
jgi:shikimate dehydrogenase